MISKRFIFRKRKEKEGLGKRLLRHVFGINNARYRIDLAQNKVLFTSVLNGRKGRAAV